MQRTKLRGQNSIHKMPPLGQESKKISINILICLYLCENHWENMQKAIKSGYL